MDVTEALDIYDPYLKRIAHVLMMATFMCLMTCYFSGVPECLTYFAYKTTGKTSMYTFVAGLLLAINWLVYGIFMKSWLFASVNVVGIVMQSSYIVMFLMFTREKRIPLMQLGIGLFLIFQILAMHYIFDPEEHGPVSTAISLMCLLNYQASPLTQLVHVIKTRCTDTLPVMTIICSFIISLLSFIKGSMTSSSYFQIPHGIGMTLSGFNLLLLVIFPRRFQHDSHPMEKFSLPN